MNKKILVIIGTFLVLSMAFTPFAFATPGANPKNNDKFQSFVVNLTAFLPNEMADYEMVYIPNEDNPNVIVQTWGDNLETNELVIGGDKHYFMGVDFAYSQSCKVTAIGAPFFTPQLAGVTIGSKSLHFVIKYEYDFSAFENGIDGTLQMLFVNNNGIISITSLRGTGDLQNVQIIATAGETHSHEGTVIGWPE